ncbi:MAG: carboxymuconolactone decarboxylase family protein [Gammaproteobacteria bacterium]
MVEFTVHTPETAPEASRPLLEKSQKAFGGMIPNIYGVMAESPALLETYQALGKLFAKTSLSSDEQHIVWLAVNYENECAYCMAAHSEVAKGAGMSDDDVNALRVGAPLADTRHEALRRFTAHMVQARGWAEPVEIEKLMTAGYTQQTMLDVILGIGHKTLSNYTNHIAHTPVDQAFRKAAWSTDDKQADAAA